jgi:hypothetical protein
MDAARSFKMTGNQKKPNVDLRFKIEGFCAWVLPNQELHLIYPISLKQPNIPEKPA